MSFVNSPDIIEQNSEKRIFHLRAPSQSNIFKNSPFAKATATSEYCAQFTTCGWVAAYLIHNLCRVLGKDSNIPTEKIQFILEQSDPDAFIRNGARFVGDLTPYGGSNDKVEGLVLGQDIYAILKGMQSPHLENVFVIEGATERADLKTNGNQLEVFNFIDSFRANYKNAAGFFPLKNAISEVASGKKPFVIIASLETFPIGQHFITYTFRRNPQNLLECLIFEGLNKAHSEWVLFETAPSLDTKRRSTTEWIYNDLECSKL